MLVTGATLGGVVGVATAGHRHVASLWDHGLMAENGSDGILYSHPAMISTDGVSRSACVAYAKDGVHGTIYCDILQHHHRYTSVPWNYFDQSAHAESSQTGLAHHHHFPHNG